MMTPGSPSPGEKLPILQPDSQNLVTKKLKKRVVVRCSKKQCGHTSGEKEWGHP